MGKQVKEGAMTDLVEQVARYLFVVSKAEDAVLLSDLSEVAKELYLEDARAILSLVADAVEARKLPYHKPGDSAYWSGYDKGAKREREQIVNFIRGGDR